MATFKNFCSVHRFNYSGAKCPFCEQDRINSLAHKFNSLAHKFNRNAEKPKTITVEREITEADLNKLRMKFNGK